MKSVQLLLATVAVLVITGCTTTSRIHPSLSDELIHVDTVAIIPPTVTIELVTFTGENERMTEKEIEVGSQLMEVSRSRLKEQGYEVIDYDFEAAIAEDAEFAYTLTQIRESFEQAKKDMGFGKPLSKSVASETRTSVGEAVNVVRAASGADAVLLITYNGFDKSGGQVAKDVATSVLVGVLTMGAVVPVSYKSMAVAEVALLDGLSGEVLWADTSNGPLSGSTGRSAMTSLPKDIDGEQPPSVGAVAAISEHNASTAAETLANMPRPRQTAPAAAEVAAFDKPIGYDKAVAVAQANRCSDAITLEQKGGNGALYSTTCHRGNQALIMCDTGDCRMMD